MGWSSELVGAIAATYGIVIGGWLLGLLTWWVAAGRFEVPERDN